MAKHTLICQTCLKHRGEIFKPGSEIVLDDSNDADKAVLGHKETMAFLKRKTGPKAKK